MNRLIDLQQHARELAGRVELVEQLRAQLVCHRVDERSLRLGTEGLLREAGGSVLGAEGAGHETPRWSSAPKRPSHMDQVQLRMDTLQRQSQARIGAMQARLQTLYMAGADSPLRLGPLPTSGSR